jgi:hypothetical protein
MDHGLVTVAKCSKTLIVVQYTIKLRYSKTDLILNISLLDVYLTG